MLTLVQALALFGALGVAAIGVATLLLARLYAAARDGGRAPLH